MWRSSQDPRINISNVCWHEDEHTYKILSEQRVWRWLGMHPALLPINERVQALEVQTLEIKVNSVYLLGLGMPCNLSPLCRRISLRVLLD